MHFKLQRRGGGVLFLREKHFCANVSNKMICYQIRLFAAKIT